MPVKRATAWARRKAQERDAIGMCRITTCTHVAVPGRKYCQEHLLSYKTREAEKRRARGAQVKDGQNGVPVGQRRCIACRNVKPLDQFHKDRHSKTGYDYRCKQCSSRRAAARIAVQTYGMTLEEIEACIERLGGCCELCGNPERQVRRGRTIRLAVDHDHVTGKVRGFLCSRCNILIGQAREDAALLRRMADYLDKHKQVVVTED